MNEYYDQEYRDVLGEEYDEIPLSRSIWVSWEDLTVQRPRNLGILGISKPSDYEGILNGVWGGAGPGEIVAILGESNSGKSLILSILAGNINLERGDLLSGRVLANGFKRGQRWRRLCAFVAQSQEELHGLLTVEEQLKFRAELALPAKWTKIRRQKVVDWALQCLDLESVQSTRVENLNLYHKKRLSIGLSLVGLPRVLLLDEPSEGLDPTRALELMKSISRITRERQMTTIITAKQLRQSTIPLIDRFLLVAKGTPVYYGTFSDAMNYFQSELGVAIPEKDDNPLTCMLDIVSSIDRGRDPNHFERICREWVTYATDNQIYRTNYPIVLADGTFYPFPHGFTYFL